MKKPRPRPRARRDKAALAKHLPTRDHADLGGTRGAENSSDKATQQQAHKNKQSASHRSGERQQADRADPQKQAIRVTP